MKCGHTEEIFFSLVYTCKKTTSSQMRNQHKRRPSWELGVGFTEEKNKAEIFQRQNHVRSKVNIRAIV